MGNKAVKQHFDTAEKTGVLKISNRRLKVCENIKYYMKICVFVKKYCYHISISLFQDFPPQLRTMNPVLRTLDLSENCYVSIPDQIGTFTLLKHLNVS